MQEHDHSPPQTFSPGPFCARIITPGDMGLLQALAEADPDYFEITAGGPPAADEAEQLMADLPPGKTLADKFVYSLFDADGALAAVVELVRDYPEKHDWYLELLFLHPRHRAQGHGARIMADLTALLRDAGAAKLWLGVIKRNIRALRFWPRMGFTEERRTERQVRPDLTLTVLELSRAL